MKFYTKAFCLVGTLCLLASTSLQAGEKTALSVIKNSYDYTGKLDKYAFTAVITEESADEGKIDKTYRHDVKVKIHRPDMLRVDTKGDIRHRTNYLNNGTYTMVDYAFGYYGQIKTPKSIDGALDYIFKSFGITAPLSSVLYSNMSKRMKIKSGKYFGVKDVDGVACDYVAFKRNGKLIHVWVATGDKPLVKAYSIVNTKVAGHPRMNTSLTWDTNAAFTDKDFVATVTKGMTKISVEPAN
jgi:hypothetical protein